MARFKRSCLTLIPALLLVQLLFSVWVLARSQYPLPASADMVVVFTGDQHRIEAGIALAKSLHARALLISGADSLVSSSFPKEAPTFKFIREPLSTTTDQNARFSGPLILGNGAQNILLVSSWYHLPRAWLLLKFYLGWNRIQVIAVADRPLQDWQSSWRAWGELPRFWGSGVRALLAAIG